MTEKVQPMPDFLAIITAMSTKPYAVIFAGTPDFAVPSLLALQASPHFDVRLVISQPDKPVGRKREIVPTPVKQAAVQCGIEVLQPDNINQEYPHIEHDYLVVVAYGQILKEPILAAPSIAAVNVHASLLPRWRGASPMQSSILHGDTETGITIQRMVKALDAGPIFSQKTLPLRGTETVVHLHDTLADMGAKLLCETLHRLPDETPQDETQVTVCHKLSKETGELNPLQMSAVDVDRHIRALVPWPGVTVPTDNMRIKVLEASLTEVPGSVPLICKDSVLHLVTVQPPGKPPMSAKAWQHGRR